MKKIIVFLVFMMLLFSSFILVVDHNYNVIAGSGGGEGEEEDFDIGLDYDYMWIVTENLSSVVHNDSIWGGGIRKGRAFGTEGDHWTMNYIFDELNLTLDLENVDKIYLEEVNLEGWKNI